MDDGYWADLAAQCGVESLRPFQQRAVGALTRGDDVFLSVATGGGKTMVYQAAAVALGGTVVVVTPLLSLMEDQLEDCRRRGIAAAQMTAGSMHGKPVGPQILFTTPEAAALDPSVWGRRPLAIAVDEAHCVVEWGLGFRPHYAELGCLREHWPAVPIVACSASVTRPVHAEIVRILGLRVAVDIFGSMIRRNLQFSVQQAGSKPAARETAKQLAVEGGKSLIYMQNKVVCDELAAELIAAGHDAAAYHADLDRDVRTDVLVRFRSAATMVVVATTAFGMGVNIPDIRAVVNLGTPDSAMDLYQQAGRAGRDGQAATCCLVTFKGDFHGGRDAMALGERTDAAARARALQNVRGMRGYLSTTGCRQLYLTGDFIQEDGAVQDPCGMCDRCHAGIVADRAEQPVDELRVGQFVLFVSRVGRKGRDTMIDALCRRKTPRSKNLIHLAEDGWPTDRPGWKRAFEVALERGLVVPHALALRPRLHVVVYSVP
jgi:ATP-dependent DNA helicase RecQ